MEAKLLEAEEGLPPALFLAASWVSFTMTCSNVFAESSFTTDPQTLL
jgi:hypothetical protein